MLKLDMATQQEEKSPKDRHKNQRSAHSHTQESSK